MHLADTDESFILDGVQTIATMAVGTETISKVDFSAGPGNAFVAEAKRQMFGQCDIDLLAGPTEVLAVADEQADPYMGTVDLLSRAEHGPDTPAQLVTNSERVGKESLRATEELLRILPTRDVAAAS
jgi:histidinol dehydrogenase